MEMPKEHREYAAGLCLLVMVKNEIKSKNYNCLAQLYEVANIDNKKLVEMIDEPRSIGTSPEETVFADILMVIFDESKTNPSILLSFYEYYAKRYPNVVKAYKLAEEAYARNQGIDKSFQALLKTQDELTQFFALFHLYYFDTVDFMAYDYDHVGFATTMTSVFFKTDENLGDDQYTFNTDEPMFPSKQFDRFLNKQKEKLAIRLNEYYPDKKFDAENLSEKLEDILKSKATSTDIPIGESIDTVITGSSRRIMAMHNGGTTWYDQITNDGKTGYGYAQDYTPDLEKIIQSYYMEYVKYRVRDGWENQKNGFSKLYLTRECETDSVDADLFAIMYLFNVDVYCELFFRMFEQYYKNFSWEKISHQTIVEKYKKIVASLDKQVEDQVNKTRLYLEQNQELRAKIVKGSNIEVLPFEKMLGSLNKKIEDKDNEISSLKRQLESKEKYIELLSKEVPEKEKLIDVESLQQKKYLFVGRMQEAFPELRKKFPDSIFMESETYSLQNIKVDGIVMMIKFMSHSMFYKVNADVSLTEVPVVYFNNRNIKTLYNVMSELI